MFRYDIVHSDAKSTVMFEGDVDIDVTEIIEESVIPELMLRKYVDIDFAKVSFVDSSGIGLLISLVRKLQGEGSEVVIKHVSTEVKMIFDLLQLPDILGHEVFEDNR